MKVLVVNSHVVAGHVGGRIQVPVLQALGHEAWHVPTVLFSNHPAHGGFTGKAVDAALVDDLLAGLEAHDFRPDTVLSGYLGTAETGVALANYLERLGPEVPYCCDPVLGDDGRIYVADGILEVLRERLLPRADLATPNRNELSWISGHSIDDDDSLCAALSGIAAEAVCTSARIDDSVLTSLAVGPGTAAAVDVPRRPDPPHGTGDLFAAALLGHRAASGNLATALGKAVATVDLVLGHGIPGDSELALPASLPDLVRDVPGLATRPV